MRTTAAASRYARALLEIAIEQNKVDSVLGDMNFLFEVADDSLDFELLVASPIVQSDKKIAIFEKIFDQFEELSMSFIRLITNNGREKFLPQIAMSFEAQVKEYKGIVPVTLISAHQLDEVTKDMIMNKVSGAIQGTPEITEKIDEDLIGGFVVRMGDMQVDASVETQLFNLKQSLSR